MSKAKELYADCEYDDYFLSTSSYQPILESFGNIVIQVDDNDYQGDSRVLFKNEDKYGYLQFGWGSCSGCDALQACDSFDEVDKLIEELRDSIKWFTKTECIEFFENHDWEGDYSWLEDGQKEFINKVKDYLRNS